MKILTLTCGPLGTNCYVALGTTEATIIDPGMGAAPLVRQEIEKAGLTVSSIVLTHGHIDHIRDAGELSRDFGVPVHIHPADEHMLDGGPLLRELFDVPSMVRARDVEKLEDKVRIAGEDYRVLPAPGHSPGSVLLVGQEVCWSGDVLFRGGIGRTDLPGSDPEAMLATLRGPVASLDAGLRVLPGHGPETTVEQEKATNPFLRAAGG
ncbi:MBL fold metallo-hydrolase [Corynebacterium lowii]|uniref:Putative metallo-hydrolase n=1 Tax=Corynebacterium lowii TaxID=1544413 RepID=A0A0Q0YIH6_9CORY|nr:MBL fold metallo-hydrolase [Corynebacterium lowii]KQB86489.1 putative metallo-hydrolase [Corynebacterium lowii]MDP9851169.1 glyoxylase-like metal-dependent hydrolase (beta-lactamase superfamily II) [Corynebacterium lowii]